MRGEDSLDDQIERVCQRLAVAGTDQVTAGDVARRLPADADPRQVGRHLSLHGTHGDEYETVSVETVDRTYSNRYRIELTEAGMERLLDAERSRRLLLFEENPDPIVELAFSDGSPIVTAVNSAFEAVFGFDSGDVVGRDAGNVAVPEDCREEGQRPEDLICEGQRIESDVERQTATGPREFLLRVVPFEEDEQAPGAYVWYVAE